MIHHIVLYKFNSDIYINKEVLDTIVKCFSECKEQLHGILSLHFGENVSLKKQLNHWFTHGLYMTFENTETIKEYNTLPAHQEAQTLMQPYQKDVLVFDIES